MQIDLEALGLPVEDLQNRVVDKMASMLLESVVYDDEAAGIEDSPFARKLKTETEKRLDEHVTALGDNKILPLVTEMVEKIALQKTNTYGEARGEKMSFVEYLVHRAEEYMTEIVDFDGKPPSTFTTSKQTRIAQMIDKHLHYRIKAAMEQALQNANNQIVKGLEKTAILKLREIAERLRVTVETR